MSFRANSRNLAFGPDTGGIDLTREADGKWTYLVLYSFIGGVDGANPFAGLVLDASGNMYGTTYYGGTADQGTVFEFTP